MGWIATGAGSRVMEAIRLWDGSHPQHSYDFEI